MMKTQLIALMTALCLVAGAGPALADDDGWSPDDLLTGENIGRAIGAAAGALLGAQIGDGSGQVLAVAIGTLAGYWLGGEIGRRLTREDQAGIAYSTQRALETGRPQTWHNPDTGVATRVSVQKIPVEEVRPGLPPLDEAPALKLINEFYTANANVNVRGGPSTDYAVLYVVHQGERVPVLGRVAGSKWLMIARQGAGSGFVYGPLFTPTGESDNAVRALMDTDETFAISGARSRECRRITQEVSIPGVPTRSHAFKVCRQPGGTWTKV